MTPNQSTDPMNYEEEARKLYDDLVTIGQLVSVYDKTTDKPIKIMKQQLQAIASFGKKCAEAQKDKDAEEVKKMMHKVYDMGDVKVGTKWCVNMLSSLAKKIRSQNTHDKRSE